MSASNHFTKLSHRSGYAKAKGVPFPKLAVAGTGVLPLLGGASVLLRCLPCGWDHSANRLHARHHLPHAQLLGDARPQMKQADMMNLLKNMELVGALLMLLATPQPWPFSLASR